MYQCFLLYFISALLIVFSGAKLVKVGDEIAEYFDLNRLWLGAVLIAAVTSLPELVTSITSTKLNLPDMAISNVLGSNIFNIFALIMFIIYFPFKKKMNKDSIKTLSLSVLFTVFVALFITFGWKSSFLSIGYDSILILVLYLLFIKMIFKKGVDVVVIEKIDKKKINVSRLIGLYILCAFFIFIGGYFSVIALNKIAIVTGLGERFLGVLFLAVATSLPEVVTAFSAAKLGYSGMLVGIIIGSNLYNICVLSVCDLFIDGNFFAKVDTKNIYTCLFLVFMSLLLFLVFYLKKMKSLHLKKVSLLAIVSYILIIYIIYKF
jgi:cation:H+ antiporter